MKTNRFYFIVVICIVAVIYFGFSKRISSRRSYSPASFLSGNPVLENKPGKAKTNASEVNSIENKHPADTLILQKYIETSNDTIVKTVPDPISGQYAILHSDTKEIAFLDKSGNTIWSTNIANMEKILGACQISSIKATSSAIEVVAFGQEGAYIFINKDTGKVRFDVH